MLCRGILRGLTTAPKVGDPVAASSSYRAQLSSKKQTPAQPVSATTSRTPAFRPPAPAKAVNPLARQVAARSVSPALERPPVPRQSSVAATGTFKLPKLSTEISSLRAPAAPRNGPLHDPDREGALVMLRPDAAHQAEYNKRCVGIYPRERSSSVDLTESIGSPAMRRSSTWWWIRSSATNCENINASE